MHSGKEKDEEQQIGQRKGDGLPGRPPPGGYGRCRDVPAQVRVDQPGDENLGQQHQGESAEDMEAGEIAQVPDDQGQRGGEKHQQSSAPQHQQNIAKTGQPFERKFMIGERYHQPGHIHQQQQFGIAWRQPQGALAPVVQRHKNQIEQRLVKQH